MSDKREVILSTVNLRVVFDKMTEEMFIEKLAPDHMGVKSWHHLDCVLGGDVEENPENAIYQLFLDGIRPIVIIDSECPNCKGRGHNLGANLLPYTCSFCEGSGRV